MRRIAIAGATGYIGGRLAPQLLDAGYALRCLVRSPGKLEGREWTANSWVEIREADLSDAPSLARQLEGCEAAYYLVHSMMSAGGEYARRDRQLALTFARAARDAGVNLAFLGANAMFRRTRLAATGVGPDRLVICYRTSYLEDPMYGKDNALVTTDWREPPSPEPESSLTGTLYESNPTTADYVVATPDSWIFAGTGVAAGTRFPGLVGAEYDRVNPEIPVQRPIQVLAHSPLTCRGINSFADSAYYTHSSGAGVFNSGTMRWVQAIDGGGEYGIDVAARAFVTKATANVLRAFAEGPAAASHPANDNLEAMHEYAGDPIAAQQNLW